MKRQTKKMQRVTMSLASKTIAIPDKCYPPLVRSSARTSRVTSTTSKTTKMTTLTILVRTIGMILSIEIGFSIALI